MERGKNVVSIILPKRVEKKLREESEKRGGDRRRDCHRGFIKDA